MLINSNIFGKYSNHHILTKMDIMLSRNLVQGNFWSLYSEKLSQGSETSDMTSEGLGEIFEGDLADTCAEKFLLVLIGG